MDIEALEQRLLHLQEIMEVASFQERRLMSLDEKIGRQRTRHEALKNVINNYEDE